MFSASLVHLHHLPECISVSYYFCTSAYSHALIKTEMTGTHSLHLQLDLLPTSAEESKEKYFMDQLLPVHRPLTVSTRGK